MLSRVIVSLLLGFVATSGFRSRIEKRIDDYQEPNGNFKVRKESWGLLSESEVELSAPQVECTFNWEIGEYEVKYGQLSIEWGKDKTLVQMVSLNEGTIKVTLPGQFGDQLKAWLSPVAQPARILVSSEPIRISSDDQCKVDLKHPGTS